MEQIFSLKGKNAIVTGAASGLGKQCAHVLAKVGARVALADKNAKGLLLTADFIRQIGGESLAITCDVTQKQTVRTAVETAVSVLRQIHILVNCAGIFSVKNFFEISESDWDKLFDTNLKGSWQMGQLVAEHMVEQGVRSSIIDTIWNRSHFGNSGLYSIPSLVR